MIFFGCWPIVTKRTCIKGGFHDILALFYIVIYNVHARCLIKCLLSIFSLVWNLMSTKLWGFSCFLTSTIFGSLIMYLTHLAIYVHFQCFGHVLHITTFCTPCFSILAYHVYLMFCSILFYLLFEFYFLIHLAPLLHLSPWSYLHLLPFFLLYPFIYSCQKGESIHSSSIPESFVISI